jgi:hypothetical protein
MTFATAIPTDADGSSGRSVLDERYLRPYQSALLEEAPRAKAELELATEEARGDHRWRWRIWAAQGLTLLDSEEAAI